MQYTLLGGYRCNIGKKKLWYISTGMKPKYQQIPVDMGLGKVLEVIGMSFENG